MSHYAVAVFSDDGFFDYLLEPYDENNKKYYVFEPVPYEQIEEDFAKFRKQNPSWTLDMFIEEYGYIEKDGQWGYEHNPQGYWDWYSLDGKDYLFDLKEDCASCDEDEDFDGDYRKNDYDWYPDNSEDVKEAEKFWDEYVEQGLDVDGIVLWSRDYYRDRFKTKKQFVKETSRTVPYAFITPDGVWHSPGRIGWFACSDETAEDWEKYVKEWDAWIASEANPYVNLVDCHI